MAKTIIHKNQAFEVVSGETDERISHLTDNLVVYLPMDYSSDGIYNNCNLIDSKNYWEIGAGDTQGIYTRNGELGINKVIRKTDPWGNEVPIWACESNDATSDADGGWNITGIPVDNTKTYRFTTWVRRENVGNGSTYLGVQGGTVYYLGTTTVNNNPYFKYFTISGYPEDEWFIIVGHVHPWDYSGSTHPDTGVWNMNGVKLAGATDYQWTSGVTTSGHRSYLYYSTSTTERHYWYDPRMEIVDDSTSTLTELLQGSAGLYHATSTINPSVASDDGVGIGEVATNEITNPTGLLGSGEPGSYTPGWDTSLHDDAFLVSNWGGGYNAGVPSSGTGYHAKWVREGADGGPCMKMIDRNDLYGLGHRWLGITQTITTDISNKGWVSGTTLTVSWCQKTDTLDKKSHVGFYHQESGVNTFDTYYIETYNTVINKWEQFAQTWTIDGDWDSNSFLYLYFYGHYGGYGTIWYDNIQITETNHQIPFFTGTTASVGEIEYTLPEDIQTFSIIGKFNPYTPFDNTYDYTADQASLFRVQDDINTGGIYYRYYVSGVTSAPFIDPDGAWRVGAVDHIHNSYTINAYDEITFVITKTGTSFDFKLYQDGTWKTTHSYTLALDGYLSKFIIGGTTTVWNGDYRDIAIYNRVLTSDEINILVKSEQALSADGDVYTKIDNEINSNVWPNPNLDTTTYGIQGIGTVTYNSNSDGTYHELDINNLSGTYRGYDIDVESGSTYLFSAEIWVSSGHTFTHKPIQIENAITNTINETYSNMGQVPVDTWVRAEVLCLADANIRALIYPTSSSAGTGIFRWRNVTLKKINTVHSKLSQGIYQVGDLIENQYNEE